MDLGNLFVLINYHHMMEGGTVDIDRIIEKNLQTLKFPTHTISTRHIFRKVSEQAVNPPGKLSQHKSDSPQNDSETETQPKIVQGSTSETSHRKTISQRNNVPKRQIEIKCCGKGESNKLCKLGNCCKMDLELDKSDSSITKKQKLNNSAQPKSQDRLLQRNSHSKDRTEIVPFKEYEFKFRESDKDYCTKGSENNQVCKQLQVSNGNERSLNIQSSVLKTFSDQESNMMEKITEMLVKAQSCFNELPESRCSTSQGFNPKPIDVERSDGVTQEHVQALEMVLHLIQIKIKQIVKFSKSIPGFSDLSIHDRLVLMKGSKSESQMIGSVVIDSWNRSFQLSSDKKMGMDVIQNLFPREYLEQKFVITQKLNALHLSSREMAVLRAIIITYPDREGLEDQHAVDKLYHKLIDCFHHVLKQDNCQDIPVRICQIDHVLKFMRETTLTFNHVLENLFEKTNKLNNYGLIKEFMDM